MATAVRYIVEDIGQAIPFYESLGFEVTMHPAPGFAMLALGDLRLYLNSPGAGGAGRAADDGSTPTPGGWNRFQIVVANLDAEIRRLKDQGAVFRTELAEGAGGRQSVVEDPSGNPVELFEPAEG